MSTIVLALTGATAALGWLSLLVASRFNPVMLAVGLLIVLCVNPATHGRRGPGRWAS